VDATRTSVSEEANRSRIRLGVSGHLGTLVFAGDSPVAQLQASVSGRFGWQVTDLFGVYVQQTLGVVPMTWEGGGVAFSSFTTVLGSFTFLRRLEVAAGPSMDLVGWTIWRFTGGYYADAGVSWPILGVHGRVAYTFGNTTAARGRRRGFTISLDVHPLVSSVSYCSLALGAGYEWF
jgi:hypothetical protein